jgi:hypothetical protein
LTFWHSISKLSLPLVRLLPPEVTTLIWSDSSDEMLDLKMVLYWFFSSDIWYSNLSLVRPLPPLICITDTKESDQIRVVTSGGSSLTKGRLLYQISEEKNQYNTSFRSNISSEESDQIRVVTSGGRGLIKGRLLNCTRLWY